MAVKANRKRYILFEIISDKELSLKSVNEAIFSSSQQLLGELETSKAHLIVLSDFYKNHKSVIQVNHNYVQKIKLALALIKKINNQDVIIQTKTVFGTLKKIKSYF
jgi:ribonuclease P/MRP protein subunit POP5